MATRFVSLEPYKGSRTILLYQFLHANLYEKNWKDAPVIRELGFAAIAVFTAAYAGFVAASAYAIAGAFPL